MAANELQNVAVVTAADPEAAGGTTAPNGTGPVGAAASPSADVGSGGDRLRLDILSREPVLRFTESTDAGTSRTVTVGADPAAAGPSSADRPGRQGAGRITTGASLRLAEHPVVRSEPGQDGGPGHTEVMNPKTGEVVARLDSNDFYGLDEAIRAFTRESLLDKSA